MNFFYENNHEITQHLLKLSYSNGRECFNVTKALKGTLWKHQNSMIGLSVYEQIPILWTFVLLRSLLQKQTLETLYGIQQQKPAAVETKTRLGIGRGNVMRSYFERFLHLQSLDWNLGRRWNVEKYLEVFLQSKNIHLKAHPDMNICKVKPLSRKRRSSP